MNNDLALIHSDIYQQNDLHISDFISEKESNEYDACRFYINGKKIICRNAKVTPKKSGQFVTFWKRNKNGVIEPYHLNDEIDFFVVNVLWDDLVGQFVFPKSELIKRGIISSEDKEGKRAFRVYPTWHTPESKQALKTQNWQKDYFYDTTELIKVKSVLKQLHE